MYNNICGKERFKIEDQGFPTQLNVIRASEKLMVVDIDINLLIFQTHVHC